MSDETTVAEPQETVAPEATPEPTETTDYQAMYEAELAKNDKLRKENAKHRTKNRDERKELAEAVGLDADAKYDDIASQMKALNSTVYNLQLNQILGEVCDVTEVNRELAVPYLRSRGALENIDLADPQAAAASLVEVFTAASEEQPALKRAASDQRNWSQPEPRETRAVADSDAMARLERLAVEAQNTGDYAAYLKAQKEVLPGLMSRGAYNE